jgi:tellurite resistance protein TehA-like permease
LNRLFSYGSLPLTLVPTLAIELAPHAVAGVAYFALTGYRPRLRPAWQDPVKLIQN